MAFLDALQDTVTISSVTTGFKSGDTIGQEVKTLTTLYSNVPCRMNVVSTSGGFKLQEQQGKQENFKYLRVLQMKPEHNGANRGDKATVNGIEYTIMQKIEVRGRTSAIHHVIYYLEELK